MDIFPSLLTRTADELDIQLKRVLPFFNKLQIDIADNVLVDGQTQTVSEALQRLISQPAARDTILDFHLMVQDFLPDLQMLEEASSKLNLRYVLVHHAAKPSPELFIRQPYAFKIGLVLNPEDTVDTIKNMYELDKIAAIQLMTVYPGAQGRPFIPDMLNKIEQLRKSGYRSPIMLDGAINDTTLPVILRQKYRPDVVCPGSYFSTATDIAGRIRILRGEIDQAGEGS